MPHIHEPIIGLPDFKLVMAEGTTFIEIHAQYVGKVSCLHCSSERLRTKETFVRRIRHHSIGIRNTVLIVKTRKFQCRECRRYFHQRLPGILPYQRVTEHYKEQVSRKHHHGFCKSTVSREMLLGTATVERYYQRYLKLRYHEVKNNPCPRVLGIDEKFFTKKRGYMTTLADLKRRKVFDLALGRSERSLEPFLAKIPERHRCKVAVIDLCEGFRSMIQKWFENALIVADRFHVIRLVNHHYLKAWTQFDEQGRKNRGLLSLMRRHQWKLSSEQKQKLKKYLQNIPGLELIYEFKQRLCALLLSRVSSKHQARPLVQEFLEMIALLKQTPIPSLKTLGETLENWQEEIVRMWRFSRTNSTTEGLHNRMEEILRRAYGMQNFQNFRIRVKALCG